VDGGQHSKILPLYICKKKGKEGKGEHINGMRKVYPWPLKTGAQLVFEVLFYVSLTSFTHCLKLADIILLLVYAPLRAELKMRS